jgi:hypothetical protein
MQKNSKPPTKDTAAETSPALNTRFFWCLIAAFVGVDAIGLTIEGISVVPEPLWDMTWRIAALIIVSLFYTYYRPDVRLATLMHAVAMFSAASTPISIFYYLATSWHQPLVDAHLAAADHALGLDWVATYHWVASVPALQITLATAYYSLLPQAIVLIFALNFLGLVERSWELPWLLIVAAIIIVPFSILTPAIGAFGYYHINEGEPYVQIFKGLYDGTLRTLDFQTMQGVVQFPSLHAASAIMMAYAARGIKGLFPFYVLLNTLMFLATPPLGGHYFADVLGGIILAAATILIVRKYCSTLLAPKSFAQPEAREAPAR